MSKEQIKIYDKWMSKYLDGFNNDLVTVLELLRTRNEVTPEDIVYDDLIAKFEDYQHELEFNRKELMYNESSYESDKQYYKDTLTECSNKHKTVLRNIIKLQNEKCDHYQVQISLAEESNKEALDKFKLKLNLCRQKIINHEDDLENIKITVSRIEHKYNELTKSSFVSTVSDYNENWKWSERLTHILRNEGRILSLNQMLDRIFDYEPNLKSKGDKRLLIKNLSGILKYYCDDGLFKRTNDQSTFLYGLPDWFGADNEVKAKYRQA